MHRSISLRFVIATLAALVAPLSAFRLQAADGPFLVKDIYPGTGPGYADSNYRMTGNGQRVFFGGFDMAHGQQLWTSDGTAAGTIPLTPFPTYLTMKAYDIAADDRGLVYFMTADKSYDARLWVTQGTAASTHAVADLAAGSSSIYSIKLLPAGNRIFAVIISDKLNGVWISDGTSGGTLLLKNFTGDPAYTSAGVKALLVDGGILYFAVFTSANGIELWKSNGTAGGTIKLKSINNDVAALNAVMLSGILVFITAPHSDASNLWSYNCATGALLELKSSIALTKNSFIGLSSFQGRAYFLDYQMNGFFNLVRTDGTLAGTVTLKTLEKPASSGDPAFIMPGTNRFLIATGNALWSSDGTTAGTVPLRAFDQITYRYKGNVARFPGRDIWFLSANGAGYGQELWQTDGTPAGTTLRADINAGSNSSAPQCLTVAGSYLFFAAMMPASGMELCAMPLAHAYNPVKNWTLYR